MSLKTIALKSIILLMSGRNSPDDIIKRIDKEIFSYKCVGTERTRLLKWLIQITLHHSKNAELFKALAAYTIKELHGSDQFVIMPPTVSVCDLDTDLVTEYLISLYCVGGIITTESMSRCSDTYQSFVVL